MLLFKEECKTKVKPVLLWENQNPNESFAPQEVAIPSLAEYDYYIVKVKYAATGIVQFTWENTMKSSGIAGSDRLAGCSYDQGTGQHVFSHFRALRIIPVSSKVIFGDGYEIKIQNTDAAYVADSFQINQSYAIPVQIYGVKE